MSALTDNALTPLASGLRHAKLLVGQHEERTCPVPCPLHRYPHVAVLDIVSMQTAPDAGRQQLRAHRKYTGNQLVVYTVRKVLLPTAIDLASCSVLCIQRLGSERASVATQLVLACTCVARSTCQRRIDHEYSQLVVASTCEPQLVAKIKPAPTRKEGAVVQDHGTRGRWAAAVHHRQKGRRRKRRSTAAILHRRGRLLCTARRDSESRTRLNRFSGTSQAQYHLRYRLNYSQGVVCPVLQTSGDYVS